MAQRTFGSAKRNRQYEKIKKSAKRRGRSTATAKRIAAATTNKERRARGEVKGRSKSRRSSGSSKRSTRSTTRKSRARKSSKS